MRPIPVGAKGSFTLVVMADHLANRFKDATLPPVLATPVMIMMMENAALNAIKPYLDPGESAVGTRVDVRHLAATPAGRTVSAEAEVTGVEGRLIAFRIEATDGVDRIGTGTHERMVIDLARFSERLNRASIPRAAAEPAGPELSQAIVVQAPDAIVFADRDGVIRMWNRGAERIFGYPAAEALGASLDLIIPERFRRAHWEGFQRAIDTGRTKYADRVLTTRSAHRDGSKLYVDLSFGLVRGDQGAILGALAIGRDCTARYAADAELRSRLAALEAGKSSGKSADA